MLQRKVGPHARMFGSRWAKLRLSQVSIDESLLSWSPSQKKSLSIDHWWLQHMLAFSVLYSLIFVAIVSKTISKLLLVASWAVRGIECKASMCHSFEYKSFWGIRFGHFVILELLEQLDLPCTILTSCIQSDYLFSCLIVHVDKALSFKSFLDFGVNFVLYFFEAWKTKIIVLRHFMCHTYDKQETRVTTIFASG